MLFNFYINNYLFLALARRNTDALYRAIKRLPQTTLSEQLATFIRNHDELDLDRLTSKEREEVYKTFAPKEEMRIYGRGIRRRLAPMLNNNRRWMELVYSLLLSLPGTPVLRYGDEIGMGEDLSLEQRHSVRTAMQWSSKKHGGFSKTDDELQVPVIKGGEFGYEQVNVYSQLRNPASLLTWFERAISVRKECIEFGYGDYELIKTDNPAVFAHLCYWENEIVFAVHNFSENEITVTLKHKRDVSGSLEYFADQHYEKASDNFTVLKLAPFGYRWFKKNSRYE
jgi:maltose alpha-D-glucosyltransferase/alpha-amylase